MHFFHHYSVFFYADYGILYEELLVRAKKNTSRVAYAVYDLCACTYIRIRIRVYFAFTYDDLFQQYYGCISSIELRNS